MEDAKKTEEVKVEATKKKPGPKPKAAVDKEKEALQLRVKELEAELEGGVLVPRSQVEEIRELLDRSCRQSNNVPFRQQLKKLLSTFGR